VAVIDDHALVSDALHTLLETKGGFAVVGTANSAAHGLRLVTEAEPDVALVDLRLPDGDGLDLIRKLRATVPCTKVLVVTAADHPMTIAQAMEAGIHGYLTKSGSGTQLLHAIRAAHGGGMYFDEVARKALESWSLNPQRLSETEIEILRLVERGVEQAEIARTLNVATSTLKRQLQMITLKLDARNTADAAYEASRRGLI